MSMEESHPSLFGTYKFWAWSSIAASFIVVNLVPQLSVWHSYYWTASVFFFAQWIIYGIYAMYLWPFHISPLRHLPGPKGGNPFLGQFPAVIREPSGIPMRRWVQDIPNDGLLRYLHLFNRERLLVVGPKAIGEVLTTKSYDFVKPELLRTGIGQVLGIGILFAEGDEHKHQRRNFMPAFNFRHIKELYPIFWAKSLEMADGIRQQLSAAPNEAIEIGEWSSKATLDIIGIAGMGQDFNSLKDPDTELNSVYRKLFQPSRAAQILGALQFFIPGAILRALPLKRNDDVRAAATVARSTAARLVQQKKLDMAANKSLPPDIISVALSSGIFTDGQLVDNMMTFLAAGHETTASATQWAVYLMTQHPHVQQKLRAEIHQHIPDPSVPMTAEIIDNMPYLHAVCAETLRFYAPVPLTIREAACDTSILGHPVRKGIKVILCPWATNYDKSLWGEDADQFNPDRWMAPGAANSGGATSNYAFLTFLHGPRSCIGQKFATAELACLVAGFVGRFEFEMREEDRGKELLFRGGLTARPRDGMWCKLREVDW